jgi:hypothetical protein
MCAAAVINPELSLLNLALTSTHPLCFREPIDSPAALTMTWSRAPGCPCRRLKELLSVCSCGSVVISLHSIAMYASSYLKANIAVRLLAPICYEFSLLLCYAVFAPFARTAIKKRSVECFKKIFREVTVI